MYVAPRTRRPDSLLELDISHNKLCALPRRFRVPNGADFWSNDEKAKAVMAEIRSTRARSDKRRALFGFGCCGLGRRTGDGVVVSPVRTAAYSAEVGVDSSDGSDTGVDGSEYVPPTPKHLPRRPSDATRRARRLRRNIQPFRLYIHGNPMPLPKPRLLAHHPAEPLPQPGIVPPPLGRHPRGSGQLTVSEYDGGLWPSEAALHVELRRSALAHAACDGGAGGGSSSSNGGGGGSDGGSSSRDGSCHGGNSSIGCSPWAMSHGVRVGIAEMMGRRHRMEDACVVTYTFRGRADEVLLGVIDAHAGSDVAEQAAAEYGPELARQLGNAPLPADDATAVHAAMAKAYAAVNARLVSLQVVGGAVAVFILLRLDEDGAGGTLYTSNVGDARAVLCLDETGVRLSRDFKPFDDDEYAPHLPAYYPILKANTPPPPYSRLSCSRDAGTSAW